MKLKIIAIIAMCVCVITVEILMLKPHTTEAKPDTHTTAVKKDPKVVTQNVDQAKKTLDVLKKRTDYFHQINPHLQTLNQGNLNFVQSLVLLASGDNNYTKTKQQINTTVSSVDKEIAAIKAVKPPEDKAIQDYHRSLIASLEKLSSTIKKGNQALGKNGVRDIDENLLNKVGEDMKQENKEFAKLNEQAQSLLTPTDQNR